MKGPFVLSASVAAFGCLLLSIGLAASPQPERSGVYFAGLGLEFEATPIANTSQYLFEGVVTDFSSDSVVSTPRLVLESGADASAEIDLDEVTKLAVEIQVDRASSSLTFRAIVKRAGVVIFAQKLHAKIDA